MPKPTGTESSSRRASRTSNGCEVNRRGHKRRWESRDHGAPNDFAAGQRPIVEATTNRNPERLLSNELDSAPYYIKIDAWWPPVRQQSPSLTAFRTRQSRMVSAAGPSTVWMDTSVPMAAVVKCSNHVAAVVSALKDVIPKPVIV